MIVYKTSSFDKQINKLIKKPKYGYISCKNDIELFLQDKTVETLWNYRNTEQDISNYIRLKKTRLVNSFLKVGSSGGFRIVYIVDLQKDFVCLLYVYPKTGKYGQKNYTNEKELLSTFVNELINNELTVFE